VIFVVTIDQSKERSGRMNTPGIYHVTFSAQNRNAGEGVAVFKAGAINGGDLGYIYIGTYSVNGTNVTAAIQVIRWNQSAVSVFGPLPKFKLQLSGNVSADEKTFSVSGGVPELAGLQITISGTRLATAA
jgi:hypothetical protein